MKDNLSLEVRKAYRLLFDYQRRILDLVKFIGETYDIPFKKGNPLFSSRGNNRLDNWSWDWIYMYCYDFRFEGKDNDNPIQFSVILRNDSGYYEANKVNNISPFDIELFEPVETSKTELILIAGDLNKPFDALKESIDKPTGTTEDKSIVYKTYNLSCFFTQGEALKQLQDFSSYCESFNIPLNIPEKSI
ncbi:hypothetical protein C7H62_1560 [Mesoflavibacter sp. HG96]|uniref:hypothetical protein n=1 Tax=unclassified Mesoflavibacter TaxID=2630131 RepID=UPI000D10211C|nr:MULTISPECIES: hypothetical protein [unclassified Mesoflavibacter]QIJ89369.1 hypothetical protein C7H62_1560 [Mesoflavibacter sp. HG96]QIJ92097.1 hypothetical protein C7H56_1560 [Mesoflavibacter sp. HG37]